MRRRTRSDLIDMTGWRIGRYVVLEYVGDKCWRVQCDCGSPSKIVQGGTLRMGKIVSCGCYHREQTRLRTTKHGAARKPGQQTPTYRSWLHMRQRCMNPRCDSWDRYGGRGIRICKRWSGPAGFVNFLADMGERPDGATLDRIDNAGNYEPRNCRWATRGEQQSNRGVNVRLTVNGVTKLLEQWAKEAGFVNPTAITRRIARGWSVEDAVLTPPKLMGGRATKAYRERKEK